MTTPPPAEQPAEPASHNPPEQTQRRFGKDDRFDRTATSDHLKTLVDGVFAIVMTLLVFDIKVPIDMPGGVGLWLTQNSVRLFSYGFSFFLAGFYWLNHHNTFLFVKKVDYGQLWLNLIFLFCVGLLPFSTGLLSEHANDRLSPAIFALNLLAAGFSLYAIQRNLITNPALGYNDQRDNTLLHRGLAVRVLAPTTVYVPVIIVSLLGFPIPSLFLFLLTPFIQYGMFRVFLLPQMQKRA